MRTSRDSPHSFHSSNLQDEMDFLSSLPNTDTPTHSSPATSPHSNQDSPQSPHTSSPNKPSRCAYPATSSSTSSSSTGSTFVSSPLSPSSPMFTPPSVSYANSWKLPVVCSGLSDEDTDQLVRINAILTTEPIDVTALRNIAPGGFINSQIRRRVWPLLTGLSFEDILAERDFPSKISMEHKDHDQLNKDITRSCTHLDINQGQGRNELFAARFRLARVLHGLFSTTPTLHYIQGFHDIAAVFLFVCSDPVDRSGNFFDPEPQVTPRSQFLTKPGVIDDIEDEDENDEEGQENENVTSPATLHKRHVPVITEVIDTSHESSLSSTSSPASPSSPSSSLAPVNLLECDADVINDSLTAGSSPSDFHCEELLAYALTKRVALSHLKDTLQPSLDRTLQVLGLLFPLIGLADAEVLAFLEQADISSVFSLPWMLTWMAHNLYSFEDVCLVFDLLLASHPLMSLYYSAAAVLLHRNQVLELESDMPTVHVFMQKMPEGLNVRAVLALAQTLWCNYPPDYLLQSLQADEGLPHRVSLDLPENSPLYIRTPDDMMSFVRAELVRNEDLLQRLRIQQEVENRKPIENVTEIVTDIVNNNVKDNDVETTNTNSSLPTRMSFNHGLSIELWGTPTGMANRTPVSLPTVALPPRSAIAFDSGLTSPFIYYHNFLQSGPIASKTRLEAIFPLLTELKHKLPGPLLASVAALFASFQPFSSNANPRSGRFSSSSSIPTASLDGSRYAVEGDPPLATYSTYSSRRLAGFPSPPRGNDTLQNDDSNQNSFPIAVPASLIHAQRLMSAVLAFPAHFSLVFSQQLMENPMLRPYVGPSAVFVRGSNRPYFVDDAQRRQQRHAQARGRGYMSSSSGMESNERERDNNDNANQDNEEGNNVNDDDNIPWQTKITRAFTRSLYRTNVFLCCAFLQALQQPLPVSLYSNTAEQRQQQRSSSSPALSTEPRETENENTQTSLRSEIKPNVPIDTNTHTGTDAGAGAGADIGSDAAADVATRLDLLDEHGNSVSSLTRSPLVVSTEFDTPKEYIGSPPASQAPRPTEVALPADPYVRAANTASLVRANAETSDINTSDQSLRSTSRSTGSILWNPYVLQHPHRLRSNFSISAAAAEQLGPDELERVVRETTELMHYMAYVEPIPRATNPRQSQNPPPHSSMSNSNDSFDRSSLQQVAVRGVVKNSQTPQTDMATLNFKVQPRGPVASSAKESSSRSRSRSQRESLSDKARGCLRGRSTSTSRTRNASLEPGTAETVSQAAIATGLALVTGGAFALFTAGVLAYRAMK